MCRDAYLAAYAEGKKEQKEQDLAVLLPLRGIVGVLIKSWTLFGRREYERRGEV
jgi:hypothetical protein